MSSLFKVLKHKTREDIFGTLQNQEIHEQHVPDPMSPEITLKDIREYLDPNVVDELKNYDLKLATLNYVS